MDSHVSPFVFTTTLLPLLEATAKLPGADVRVVTVRHSSRAPPHRKLTVAHGPQVASTQHFRAPLSTKFDSAEDFRLTYADEGKEGTFASKGTRYGEIFIIGAGMTAGGPR